MSEYYSIILCLVYCPEPLNDPLIKCIIIDGFFSNSNSHNNKNYVQNIMQLVKLNYFYNGRSFDSRARQFQLCCTSRKKYKEVLSDSWKPGVEFALAACSLCLPKLYMKKNYELIMETVYGICY